MASAIQSTRDSLDTIHSIRNETHSFQKSLFTLWMDLEKKLQTVTENDTASFIDTSDSDNKLDEIIDAQDQIADVVCDSRAETFEGLLYKLAIWRSDTPDFETMPIDADRKDRIIYSVFRDLIKITGMDFVKTHVDDTTNFLGG